MRNTLLLRYACVEYIDTPAGRGIIREQWHGALIEAVEEPLQEFCVVHPFRGELKRV